MIDSYSDGTERRPRDLALLLLARGDALPRQRARDQQADRAGTDLSRRILDRLTGVDPDPADCAAALQSIVEEMGEPTGPTRASALMFLQEWHAAQLNPSLWAWLLSEAIEAADASTERSRKGKRWSSTD